MMGPRAGHLNRGRHTWSSPPDLKRLKACCQYTLPPKKTSVIGLPGSHAEGIVVRPRGAWESSEEEEEDEEDEEMAHLAQWEGASGRPVAPSMEDSEAQDLNLSELRVEELESTPAATRRHLDPPLPTALPPYCRPQP